MKQILKQGAITYYKTCPICGCEFSYESSDVENETAVACPCCSTSLAHQTIQNDVAEKSKVPNQLKPTNECLSCPYYRSFRTGIQYLEEIDKDKKCPYKITCQGGTNTIC